MNGFRMKLWVPIVTSSATLLKLVFVCQSKVITASWDGLIKLWVCDDNTIFSRLFC